MDINDIGLQLSAMLREGKLLTPAVAKMLHRSLGKKEIVRISSPKGPFQGSLEDAIRWLVEMQPSYASVVNDDGEEESIDSNGTEESDWREGLEFALDALNMNRD